MNAIGISLAIILNLLITLASIGILTVLISNPWAWDILAFIVSFWGGGIFYIIRVGLVVKKQPANAGDIRDTRGMSPGVGHGNPLQYSCLENPMDRGAW